MKLSLVQVLAEMIGDKHQTEIEIDSLIGKSMDEIALDSAQTVLDVPLGKIDSQTGAVTV